MIEYGIIFKLIIIILNNSILFLNILLQELYPGNYQKS